MSGVDYVNALRRCTELGHAVEAQFGDVDVLVATSTMDPGCPIDDKAAIEYTHPRQSRVPFNLSGHPALSVESGFHGRRTAAGGADRRSALGRGCTLRGCIRF